MFPVALPGETPYYDDSSAALGLSHAPIASESGLTRKQRIRVLDEAAAGDRISRPGGIREWDLAQRAAIIAARDADRARAAAELTSQGIDAREARAIVLREESARNTRPSADRLGDTDCASSSLGASVEELMAHATTGHGGSHAHGRRFGRVKAKRGYGGRYAIEDEPRSVHLTAHVTPQTQAVLQGFPGGVNGALAAIARGVQRFGDAWLDGIVAEAVD